MESGEEIVSAGVPLGRVQRRQRLQVRVHFIPQQPREMYQRRIQQPEVQGAEVAVLLVRLLRRRRASREDGESAQRGGEAGEEDGFAEFLLDERAWEGGELVGD